MALMNVTTFKGYSDRIATQFSYIKVAFDALSATGVGDEYYTRITSTEDPDVELAMLSKAYDADEFWKSSTPTSITRGYTKYTSLIKAFEDHLAREGTLTARSWDAYCTDQDVRVSDYTNQVYYARNNNYMKAPSVFSEDVVTFGEAEMTGASTVTFTDEADFGDGTATNVADKTKVDVNGSFMTGYGLAGQQLKVVCMTDGIASLEVQITGLDSAGVAKIQNVVVTGNTGDEVTVGTVTDRWVDVTNVTYVSGGGMGDIIELQNIKERTIAL